MQHRCIPMVSALALALTLSACGSATTANPDSGTSAGNGGTGGTAGTGGTGGMAGTGGSAGNGGAGGSAGSAGSAGTGGNAGDAGTGGVGGAGGSGGCTSPAQCNDGIDCTADDCVGGRCTNVLTASLCGAGRVCDLRQGGCTLSTPCGDNTDCADNDPCTRNERCDLSTASCQWDLLDNDNDGHTPITCGGDDFDDNDPTRYSGAPEICDGKDNDGDGVVDNEPAATETCLAPNGAGVCVEGACAFTCDDGFGDCDGEYTTGCESELLNNPAHCGRCGFSCHTCNNGECGPGACNNPDDVSAYERRHRWRGFTSTTHAAKDHCSYECRDAPQRDTCETDCFRELTSGAFSEGCSACLVAMSLCYSGSGCGDSCSQNYGCLLCACTNGCVEDFEACSGIAFHDCDL